MTAVLGSIICVLLASMLGVMAWLAKSVVQLRVDVALIGQALMVMQAADEAVATNLARKEH